jgi:hypothetical protein
MIVMRLETLAAKGLSLPAVGAKGSLERLEEVVLSARDHDDAELPGKMGHKPGSDLATPGAGTVTPPGGTKRHGGVLAF